MSLFERTNDDGKVVERVRTIENSHEDNRLGVAALESTGGWRKVDEHQAAGKPSKAKG